MVVNLCCQLDVGIFRCVCVCLQTNITLENNSRVVACLSQGAPVFQLNQSQTCSTGMAVNSKYSSTDDREAFL